MLQKIGMRVGCCRGEEEVAWEGKEGGFMSAVEGKMNCYIFSIIR